MCVEITFITNQASTMTEQSTLETTSVLVITTFTNHKTPLLFFCHLQVLQQCKCSFLKKNGHFNGNACFMCNEFRYHHYACSVKFTQFSCC